LSRSESPAINFLCNVRVRAFLNDKFHELQQNLPFRRILFQSLSFRGDLESEGHLSQQLTGGGFHLPLPLDRNQFPTFLRPLLKIGGF
jgi:hypothetical protein